MLKFTNYKLKYTPDQYTNNNNNKQKQQGTVYTATNTHCLHKAI